MPKLTVLHIKTTDQEVTFSFNGKPKEITLDLKDIEKARDTIRSDQKKIEEAFREIFDEKIFESCFGVRFSQGTKHKTASFNEKCQPIREDEGLIKRPFLIFHDGA